MPLRIAEDRSPSIKHFEKLFDYDHFPPELAVASEPFFHTAQYVIDESPDNPETTTCLRKLLEAKDCAVRARKLAS